MGQGRLAAHSGARMSMVFCAFCPTLVDTDDDPESCVGDTYRCESCREDCAIADAADARNDELAVSA